MAEKGKKKTKTAVRVKSGAVPMVTSKTAEFLQAESVEQRIQELKDNDELVRSAAAGALGHARSEKAVQPLIAALRDDHTWVRHGAAWALGEIRSADAIEPLRQALSDNDEITRSKAAEALVKIQGE